MKRAALAAGILAALILAYGATGASGVSMLRQAIFRALGVGAVDRTAESKLRDTVSVKDFGAAGDGVTDDTGATAAARAAVVANGGTLFFPCGTYNIDATALDTSGASGGVRIIGAGQACTILKSRTGGNVIDVAGTFFHDLEIASLTVQGAGLGDGGGGHGIYIHPSSSPYGLYLHDLTVTSCGGKGIYIPQEFKSTFENISITNCSDNLFEIQGGNSTKVDGVYAHLVAAGKAGFRIYSGGQVLTNCTGIDNGGAGTAQADWGVFGQENLTAWAGTTAYTLGQLRQNSGQEYEVITAGTSAGSGGPTTISANITDGTVHWRHIGAADSVNAFFRGTIIGSDVEDFTRHGIRLKTGSTIRLFSTSILAPSTGSGYIGLLIEATDGSSLTSLMDEFSLPGTKGGTYDQSTGIHIMSGTTATLLRFGAATTLWNRPSGLSYPVPGLFVTDDGFQQEAVGMSRLRTATLAVTATTNAGTITLSSGTPSTGTATVFTNARCVCTNQTTQANSIKCAVSSTTLTATGPNTVTDVVTYLCF